MTDREMTKQMAQQITGIIKLLQSNDFRGVSDAVDIAKGRHQLPKTWKQMYNTIKRTKIWLPKKS